MNGGNEERPSFGGRGAQLLANVNAMNGNGMQRGGRGPQAKVFGIPEGTTQVHWSLLVKVVVVWCFLLLINKTNYVKCPLEEAPLFHTPSC